MEFHSLEVQGTEILRDIHTSTEYGQICRIDEKLNQTTTLNK